MGVVRLTKAVAESSSLRESSAAQLMMAGGAVVGKAVMQAYRQAVANGKAGGVTAAVSRTMRVSEARQVLNVNEGATAEEVMKAWERHHATNAGSDTFTGSPYIQAKITNAKEALLKEEAGASGETNGDSSKPGDSAPK